MRRAIGPDLREEASEASEGAKAKPRKANFFIVGAAKCGTTAWYEYLRTHPAVYFPELKETCFFATDFPSLRQVSAEEAYAGLFEDAGAATILGDASADHLYSTEAARRIHAYNPDAKILILLRAQETFLPSLHNQNMLGFWENITDFERAWRLSDKRHGKQIPPTCSEPRQLNYAASGRFSEQVERYLSLFPRRRVMVLQYERWTADPRTAYVQMLEFLGLRDDGRVSFPRANERLSYRFLSLARTLAQPPTILRRLARPVKRLLGLSASTVGAMAEKAIKLFIRRGPGRPMSEALRQEIQSYYAEDNARLRAMLERPR